MSIEDTIVVAGSAEICKQSRRVAVIASLAFSLTNFRLQLMVKMVESGYEVVAFAPDYDEDVVLALQKIGIRFVRIPMARIGLNPFEDFRTLTALWRHFRALKPDLVLSYTMKPIIYGCLAARLTGVPHRFALITGLGHLFADSNT